MEPIQDSWPEVVRHDILVSQDYAAEGSGWRYRQIKAPETAQRHWHHCLQLNLVKPAQFCCTVQALSI